MITKIELNNVTSYENKAVLETDKKVNIIYGLNGSGKSTLSNYLYDPSDSSYTMCSKNGFDSDTKVIVYNQRFVQDTFYQSDTLNGIFTLSKENKAIERKIKQLSIDAASKQTDIDELLSNIHSKLAEKNRITKQLDDRLWKIKLEYSGGDRVLEFCLVGKKKSKENLRQYLSSIEKPKNKPVETINNLKNRAEAINGENVTRYDYIQLVKVNTKIIEEDSLFKEVIVGNANSSVADLIEELGNSDWVRKGLELLPNNKKNCPFCQELTITDSLVEEIKNYFDVTYENKLAHLNKLLNSYKFIRQSVSYVEKLREHPFIIGDVDKFNILYTNFITCLENNIAEISNKVKSPSLITNLDCAETKLKALNDYLVLKNEEIKGFNRSLEEKSKTLNKISLDFWLLMRWDYDQTIESYEIHLKQIQKEGIVISKDLNQKKEEVSQIKSEITELQKQSVNVEGAIESINSALVELGITGFTIQKHQENQYKLNRSSNDSETFLTLSEGEKMMISFLYFVELCKGLETISETKHKKIIVIDDPMSSLSHLFVFNIGQLIKREFFNGNYEQIFVMTHSLYFFYELTDINKHRREENQKLFRIQKNTSGSSISVMKYEEIQNDYQSYWTVVNDEEQHPALIANCMRNIIEYFFNFVEKQDLNNVFQKGRLKEDKFQAFCRYINRESHSLGQNIFDLKEFNYDAFKEALELVFIETEYSEHYKKMSKL